MFEKQKEINQSIDSRNLEEEFFFVSTYAYSKSPLQNNYLNSQFFLSDMSSIDTNIFQNNSWRHVGVLSSLLPACHHLIRHAPLKQQVTSATTWWDAAGFSIPCRAEENQSLPAKRRRDVTELCSYITAPKGADTRAICLR